ncbi:MAG TPA: hypothetical protein PJ982_12850 [Lacipirellulaceae bacterium]|nr:hypothetical protein [Lacipirellulaceae bacterium]
MLRDQRDPAYLWDMLQYCRAIVAQRNVLAHAYGEIDDQRV